MKRVLLLTFVVFFVLQSCTVFSHIFNQRENISPYDYGLAKAKTGVERYQVLYDTHSAAVRAGVNVDYEGIKRIYIEVPKNPKRIPLTKYNDFKGCVFVVKNTTKNVRIFNYAEKETPINLRKQFVDAGDFRAVEALRRGRFLLVIEDENPWVQNRKGYDYGHKRKDVLLVENGRAKNGVTMPYNNASSKPKCAYIPLDGVPFVFKNITIERDPGCTFLTDVACISGADNVQVSNVKIHTPTSSLTGDSGIMIYNCTNVTLDNVYIDGTYSRSDHFGYGFTLNNIWNLKVNKMFGKANWGVFGNNNINVARIEDSQINRFDIHCYGRDIMFKNVEFFDLYNQYASVYGSIRYDKCTFTNFVPVLNGGSYNAYVRHDVVLNDCVYNATAKKNYIIRMSSFSSDVNARHELAEKCWPNVYINNLTVNLKDGNDYFYLFHSKLNDNQHPSIGYLSDIEINGLVVVSESGKPFKGMALSNVEIKTAKPIECIIQNVTVRQVGVPVKSTLNNQNPAILKANMPLKSGRAVLRNATELRQ